MGLFFLMTKYYKILFLNSMILGSLIAISSYSWLSMWFGLEINLLSIIPLFNSVKNYFPAEAALKYFITQSMASTIILFSILNLFNQMEMLTINTLTNQMMLNSAILTKMGAAPFHFWFPEIMEGLNWSNNLILLTWQKLAPFIIISYNITFSSFFLFIILNSTFIGGIMGMNQISLRKILTFSSINHIGWMLSSMIISNSLWFMYFLIYTLISIIIILNFKKINSFFIYQLFNFSNQNKNINLLFLLTFFSLGGLPPFLGFLPKWISVNGLISMNLYLLTFLIIVMTLITLFYYLRITFSAITMISDETILKKSWKFKFNFMILNFWNLIGLIASPMVMNFI
uniref:NADH-ubiquinone oxidoreductase chain 2 n=1 Tax=Phalacridae sp. BMNH 840198 TaxID=904146 RepID=I7E6Y9_9CUCU|nr:NADH dehydrogenase subunit 2 [Phalacridae sp. BMNH 840198]